MQRESKTATAVNIALFILFLAAAYSYEPLNHVTDNTVVMESTLDGHIPLIPEFIIPYLTLYPFVLFSLLFIAFRRQWAQFRTWLIAGIIVLLIADIYYIVLQTKMIRPDVTQDGVFYDAIRWLYRTDNPYNDFPSGHAIMSTLAAIGWIRLRVKATPYMVAWAALIFVSTVFVRQHHLADLVQGLTLVVTFYFFAWYLLEERPRRAGKSPVLEN